MIKRLALIFLVAVIASCHALPKTVVRQAPKPVVPTVGHLYNDEWFKCGCTMISDYVAITAGHCIDDPGEYSVSFDGGKTKILVVDKEIHPGWNIIEPLPDGDLAILWLGKPSGSVVATVSDYDFKLVDSLGIKFTASLTAGVRWRDRTMLYFGHYGATDKFMWLDRYAFLRPGDSGSPIWYDGKLIGVAIGSIGMDNVKVASFATDLTKYRDWINEQLARPVPRRLSELPPSSMDDGSETPRTD